MVEGGISVDFSEGKPTIPDVQGRVMGCVDKCKVVQLSSEPQPGCSPEAPEGSELLRIA